MVSLFPEEMMISVKDWSALPSQVSNSICPQSLRRAWVSWPGLCAHPTWLHYIQPGHLEPPPGIPLQTYFHARHDVYVLLDHSFVANLCHF